MADGGGKLVTRIAVFGVLGALVVLAVLDYRAKTSATETCDAWLAAVEQPNSLFRRSDLSQHVVGAPEIESRSGIGETTDTYTWAGVFRSYSVHVTLGNSTQPDDAVVLRVVGPSTE